MYPKYSSRSGGNNLYVTDYCNATGNGDALRTGGFSDDSTFYYGIFCFFGNRGASEQASDTGARLVYYPQ